MKRSPFPEEESQLRQAKNIVYMMLCLLGVVILCLYQRHVYEENWTFGIMTFGLLTLSFVFLYRIYKEQDTYESLKGERRYRDPEE